MGLKWRLRAFVVVQVLVCITPIASAVAPHAVQPDSRDRTHAVWVNGPTHTGKIGGNWPTFSDTVTSSSDTKCTTHSDSFTGYTTSGSYCVTASNELDNHAHLLLHSGRLGVVVDAGGISPAIDVQQRNLLPRLGTVKLSSNSTAGLVYDNLPTATLNATLSISCPPDGPHPNETFSLGTSAEQFVSTGLVRQGHAVTQITLTTLQWQRSIDGVQMGPCADFEPEKDPDNQNCNQDYASSGGSTHCPLDYPVCEDFVQGVRWGKCYSVCTAQGSPPELWAEVSMWGDSLSFRLAWDGPYNTSGCAAKVRLAIQSPDIVAPNNTAEVAVDAAIDEDDGTDSTELYLLLTYRESDGVLVPGSDPGEAADQAVVTTTTSGATVVSRDEPRDVYVEVPTSTSKCGYNLNCAAIGLLEAAAITVTNPHATANRTVRLSFSRGFEVRDSTLSQSTPSAEITGLNVQLWNTATMAPTGIPLQLSKNWHSGSTSAYWAGFDGNWWTASAFLRLPPNSTVDLTLVVNYERYGGVPAFSHAQLSIVGYSDRWLWEEAALGTGGENICFDPLGTHTRAFITDVRPKLFDGAWKQNVGGGDFLQFYGESGALEYLKELDPQLHATGPCLSNASYTAVTRDDAVASRFVVSGSRTDDIVRIFLSVHLQVLHDVNFTRMVIFQIGSETYNYRATHRTFVLGHGNTTTATIPRSCTGGTSKASAYMYTGGPQRALMDGTAPWWLAMDGNEDSVTLASNTMVVGDEGLVVRSFRGRLGGVDQDAPHFSILCDKFEIGPPAGLSQLFEGDFVEMELEYLILPRVGDEYAAAVDNSGSYTLQYLLSNMNTTERVRAQAIGGSLNVTGVIRSRVESNYPVRIAAQGIESTLNGTGVMFDVQGSAIGFVPVVITNLPSPTIAAEQGLWLRPLGEENFTKLQQGADDSANDFWQTNFDRDRRTYEIIFNVELFAEKTTLAFGSHPDTWPVHCEGNWSSFSSCNASCGGGRRSQTFEVTTPATNGGNECEANDGDIASESCAEHACPIDCVGAWSSFSACNATCGGGKSVRTFNVTIPAESGGVDCGTGHGDSDWLNCASDPCPIDCDGSFGDFSECSLSCGNGTQAKTFSVTTPAAHGGENCTAEDGDTEAQPCATEACPVDCDGDWTAWGACSKTCDVGSQFRSFVTETAAAFGGQLCSTTFGAVNGSIQEQNCATHGCPGDCTGVWSEWTACSTSCGGGDQNRTFNVTVLPLAGGVSCSETYGASDGEQESRTCSTSDCPVDCLGEYSNFSSCSVSCGGGTQQRTFVIAVNASSGGSPCANYAGGVDTSVCATDACPIDCVGEWEPFGTCNATCGGGFKVRTFIVETESSAGGSACSYANHSVASVACATQPCNASLETTATATPTSVGTVSVSRAAESTLKSSTAPSMLPATVSEPRDVLTSSTGGEYTVRSPAETTAGSMSATVTKATVSTSLGSSPAVSVELSAAHTTQRASTSVSSIGGVSTPITSAQAVDCVGEWTAFGSCNATCDGGVYSRSFLVTTEASAGGNGCNNGDGATDTQPCATEACPVNCAGEFGALSECSVTCGSGVYSRTYTIASHSTGGGSDCPHEHGYVDTVVCEQPACASLGVGTNSQDNEDGLIAGATVAAIVFVAAVAGVVAWRLWATKNAGNNRDNLRKVQPKRGITQPSSAAATTTITVEGELVERTSISRIHYNSDPDSTKGAPIRKKKTVFL